MAEPTSPEGSTPNPLAVKELPKMGSVEASTLGRLVRLDEPEFGTTFLVDVTDQPDSTTADPDDGPSAGLLVRGLMSQELSDEHYLDTWKSNNGVVRVVTNRFDESDQTRIYIGPTFVRPSDPNRLDVTTHILDAAGFKSGTHLRGQVPFSAGTEFDPTEMIYTEMEGAISELRVREGASQEVSNFTQSLSSFMRSLAHSG